jgi:hypothetical protein
MDDRKKEETDSAYCNKAELKEDYNDGTNSYSNQEEGNNEPA